jgi:hypothetical protein
MREVLENASFGLRSPIDRRRAAAKPPGDTNALMFVLAKIASASVSPENTGEHSAACLAAAMSRCAY